MLFFNDLAELEGSDLLRLQSKRVGSFHQFNLLQLIIV